jgi:hypothetical protein
MSAFVYGAADLHLFYPFLFYVNLPQKTSLLFKQNHIEQQKNCASKKNAKGKPCKIGVLNGVLLQEFL